MRTTSLYNNHIDKKAKIAEFAEYLMPLYYSDTGALQEHLWTRQHASIFDVSHMMQVVIKNKNTAEILEKITPSIFMEAQYHKPKYTMLLNKEGGIVDDCIITKISNDEFHIVINASRIKEDINLLKNHFDNSIQIKDESLVALQGPLAIEAIKQVIPNFNLEKQFTSSFFQFMDNEIFISRVGYTGEDGVEISVPHKNSVALWEKILTNSQIKPAGLAARNSLRIEAGYPLYGSDINENMSPIEANLKWVVKNKSCYGAEKIYEQMQNGTLKKRMTFIMKDQKMPRGHNRIMDEDNNIIGEVTSAAFLPTQNLTAGQAFVKSSLKEGDA
uniref:Aminomethyltransferase n=1 Tax=Biomphalaria glabrata TaxID=6526 RepID=A0A2C9LRH1_BIOGL